MRKFLLILAASAALFSVSAYAELPRVAGEPAWVNEKAAAAQSAARKVKLSNVQAADVAQVSFGPMAQSRIDELRMNNARAVNKALQVGIHRDLREEGIVAQQPVLSWQSLPDGGSAARFAVTSPGALALRLGLNFKDIPAGAELRFLGANDGDVAVAVVNGEEIARLRREQPVYWTPVTEGESQTVEIYLPAGAANRLRFTIDSVSHLVVSPWGKLTSGWECCAPAKSTSSFSSRTLSMTFRDCFDTGLIGFSGMGPGAGHRADFSPSVPPATSLMGRWKLM